jgi:hypothetical protein
MPQLFYELPCRGDDLLEGVAPTGTLYKLSTEQDLRGLLQDCDRDAIQRAQRQIAAKLPSAGLAPTPLATTSSAGDEGSPKEFLSF